MRESRPTSEAITAASWIIDPSRPIVMPPLTASSDAPARTALGATGRRPSPTRTASM